MAREFELSKLWSTVAGTIKGCLAEPAIVGRDVAAITATSQRQAVVFLGDDDEEVYAGPNSDMRAVFEGGAIDDEWGDRVYRTTGHLPSFLFAPAKLKWFELQDPPRFKKTRLVLSLADWIIWRLTGQAVSEPTLANEVGLLDVNDRRWCTDLMADLGLDPELPALVDAGTMAGRVSAKAAGATGLKTGTPVAVAGADTQCGILGLGLSGAGQAGIVAGWSAPIQYLTEKPIFHHEMRTWTGCYLMQGLSVVESSAGDLGNAYRWAAETLFKGSDCAFDVMDGLAPAAPVGAEGTRAIFGPTKMDMGNLVLNTGGVFFPVPIAYEDPSPANMARAALESVAYAIKGNLLQAEEVAGRNAQVVALGGGMTRTRAFTRILADVIGREIRVSATPDITALGANWCAQVALGELGSLEDAAAVGLGGLIAMQPDASDASEYEYQYEEWLRMANLMNSITM